MDTLPNEIQSERMFKSDNGGERLSTTKEQHLLFRSKLEAVWEEMSEERLPRALSPHLPG